MLQLRAHVSYCCSLHISILFWLHTHTHPWKYAQKLFVPIHVKSLPVSEIVKSLQCLRLPGISAIQCSEDFFGLDYLLWGINQERRESAHYWDDIHMLLIIVTRTSITDIIGIKTMNVLIKLRCDMGKMLGYVNTENNFFYKVITSILFWLICSPNTVTCSNHLWPSFYIFSFTGTLHNQPPQDDNPGNKV